VQGKLTLPQGEVVVTGQAWLDREWSSQPLAAGQTGWDWFSLHLDGGEKLMGFRLRDGGDGFTSATWISAEGRPEPLPPGALKLSPLKTTEVAGRDVPTVWRVEVPSRHLDITTTALNPQAWMATRTAYWEGPIRFEGTHKGMGYLEMTGY
jgi:predicted secreted hydrolase